MIGGFDIENTDCGIASGLGAPTQVVREGRLKWC